MTRILMIGIHARALDYSKLPPGLDEAMMTERIEAGFGATTAAGFDAVNCLIGTSPDEAEAEIRSAFGRDRFGLVMIGGGIRMIPEYTELFDGSSTCAMRNRPESPSASTHRPRRLWTRWSVTPSRKRLRRDPVRRLASAFCVGGHEMRLCSRAAAMYWE